MRAKIVLQQQRNLGQRISAKMHLACSGFSCCLFLGSDALFIVTPFVCGGSLFGPCFVIQYLATFSVLQPS